MLAVLAVSLSKRARSTIGDEHEADGSQRNASNCAGHGITYSRSIYQGFH